MAGTQHVIINLVVGFFFNYVNLMYNRRELNDTCPKHGDNTEGLAEYSSNSIVNVLQLTRVLR